MIDPQTGKQVFMFDVSLLSVSDCLAKVHFIHEDGLFNPDAQYKMDYGTAVHKFIALWEGGTTVKDSLQTSLNWFLPKCVDVPPFDFRTIDHLNETCQLYAKRYGNNKDVIKPKIFNGKLCLELPFAYPYRSTPEYDIVLCGTIDKIGNCDGTDCVVDHKVTALWRKDNFFASFELDPQLRMYSWICKQVGLSTYYMPGIIDGIFIKKPTERSRNKVTGKLEVNTEWSGVSFERSPLIEFSDESMVKFEKWLAARIEAIVRAYLNKDWYENYNQCNDVYGMCEFSNICLGRAPKEIFKKRIYNPLMFQQ